MLLPNEHNQDECSGIGTSKIGRPVSTRERLAACRLRPTRQRLVLGDVIFGREHHHFTAEELHGEARRRGIQISLATVYNTLCCFSDARLIRRVTVAGKAHYDTSCGDHAHFYVEEEDRLIDIPENSLRIDCCPMPPPGFVVVGVDVLIRLRRISQPSAFSPVQAEEPRRGAFT